MGAVDGYERCAKYICEKLGFRSVEHADTFGYVVTNGALRGEMAPDGLGSVLGMIVYSQLEGCDDTEEECFFDKDLNLWSIRLSDGTTTIGVLETERHEFVDNVVLPRDKKKWKEEEKKWEEDGKKILDQLCEVLDEVGSGSDANTIRALLREDAIYVMAHQLTAGEGDDFDDFTELWLTFLGNPLTGQEHWILSDLLHSLEDACELLGENVGKAIKLRANIKYDDTKTSRSIQCPEESTPPVYSLNRESEFIEWNGLYCRSEPERVIAEALARRGLNFHLNAGGRFVVDGEYKTREPDFVVYLGNGRVAHLEIDGRQYHTSAADDHNRDRMFRKLGVQVERFTASDCLADPDRVVNEFLLVVLQ